MLEESNSRACRTSGFSLPIVLIAALMVLLGGLMLANRSSDGVISAAFQRESSDARDAAETGMTRIIGELNRPRNRGLMVKRKAGEDENDMLWRQNELANSANVCFNESDQRIPDLTTLDADGNPTTTAANDKIGFSATGSYQIVYLNSDGEIVEDKANATKAYQLLWVKRQPLVNAQGNQLLKIFQPDGHGTFRMAVRGMALRNGEVASRVNLEKDFQLTPKCCNAPFGGQHGNIDYGYDEDWNSACFPYGPGAWGILGGAAQDKTNPGSIEINGVTTIMTDGSEPQIVNPIYCIGDPPDGCTFKPTSTPYTVQYAPPVLKDVPVHPNGSLPIGSISKDTPISAFIACSLPGAPTTGTPTLKDCPGSPLKEITIDTSKFSTGSPNFCASAKGDSFDENVVHCNLEELNYGGLKITVKTASKPLWLHFPTAGEKVRATGGGLLKHDDSTDITRFSLFGCRPSNSCSSQTVKLAGSPEGLRLFVWFPVGSVSISGGSSYTGVVWANDVVSNGGVTWTVPGSGVAQAMALAGLGISEDGISPTDKNPPTFDWVARATKGFRWFGQ